MPSVKPSTFPLGHRLNPGVPAEAAPAPKQTKKVTKAETVVEPETEDSGKWDDISFDLDSSKKSSE